MKTCGGEAVAVKLLSRAINEESLFLWKEEALLLARLNHPNIISFIGVMVTPPHLGIVLELALHGSLWDAPPGLIEGRRLAILTNVCAGLAYLHGQSPTIVHRDLKSPNILIVRDLTAKIADCAC